MEKESFFSAYGKYGDALITGQSVKIDHHIEFNQWGTDWPELLELIKLSPQEVTERRKGEASKEKAVYDRLRAVVKEWEAQASQTLLCDKALEYLKTPEVEHTANEWKQQKNGVWEISNRVYTMRYKIWQDNEGDKKGTWLVSWGIAVNCPKRPATEKYGYTGNKMVVEQKKKRYDTMEAAQNYIQGRFDVHAGLFQEISPPVPDAFKRNFYINGCLLPGYKVAPPDRAEPDKKTVDALLDCLNDEDAAAVAAQALDIPEPEKEQPKQEDIPKAAKKKPERRKASPVR